LTISKVVNLKQVYVGDNVIWTIKVTNNGPCTARNVIVSDQLPNALKALSYKATRGSFNFQSCEWTIDSLKSGASETLTLVTKVQAKGIITNPVSVRTTTEESDYTNNRAMDSTEGIVLVDLEIKKYSDKTVYTKGDMMYWTIVVTNNGPCTAHGVSVSDVLPSGVRFIRYSASKGTYDVSSGKWNIGKLAKGENVTIRIYCEVLVSGKITNNASVTCDEVDSNSTNNNASATITVKDSPKPIPVKPPHENKAPVKAQVTMKNTGNPLAYLLVAICILIGSVWTRNRRE
jgi:uncharacterized repeat protein (TIGR01451 family)